MKDKSLLHLFLTISFLLFVISVLTDCNRTPTMTIKFTENSCTYNRPGSVPYGKFSLNWVVNDQKHNKTGLVILTLDADKTTDDLRAYHGAEAPSWAHVLRTDEENAFGPDLEKVRNYSHKHDFHTQASYHGEPLYLVCGNEEHMTNPLGPIEVTK